MVELRAAEFGRAACAQHSPAVAFCSLSPHFEEGKREREKDKDHKFQMSDWIFRYELSLHEDFEVSFHIKEQNSWSCFCENKHGRQRAGSVQPVLLLLCLSLFTRPAQEYIGFLTAPGTQPMSTKSSAFSADNIFPLPMTMWSIRIVFLKGISQIYLGVRNKILFPALHKDALSVSEYLWQGFICTAMLLSLYRAEVSLRSNQPKFMDACCQCYKESQMQPHSGGQNKLCQVGKKKWCSGITRKPNHAAKKKKNQLKKTQNKTKKKKTKQRKQQVSMCIKEMHMLATPSW